MKELIDFLESLGIHVNIDDTTSPILLFTLVILVLSLISYFLL